MIGEEEKKSLSALISKTAGLHFPSSRWGDLEKGVRSTCNELHITNSSLFIRKLLGEKADPPQLEVLIKNLTVGETYFFRERPVLDVFTRIILRQLFEKHREDKVLNIWIAGCCSGEEPYSIAILLKEFEEEFTDWKIKILATDINREFLDKANSGEYSAWSFRETPADLRKKYFSQKGNIYSINPVIKNMVNFTHFNLLNENPGIYGIFPNHFDVIFCRNVLMYFSPEALLKTYRLFNLALMPGGWLLTSPVEAPVEAPSGFSLVRHGEMTLLQKSIHSQPADEEPVILHKSEQQKSILIPPWKPVKKPEITVNNKTVLKHAKEKAVADTLTLAKKAFEKKSYSEVVRLLGGDGTSDPERLLLLVKSNANLGRLEEAKKLSADLVAMSQANPYFYYLQASILIELNEEEQAIEGLRKALYLDNDKILAHFLLGNLLRKKGQLKQAKKHYLNILESISEYPDDKHIPESEGLTAGYFRGMVQSLIK